MCLIAFTTTGKFLTSAEEANTRAHNPHGMGVMHFNRKGNRVVIRKSLNPFDCDGINAKVFAVHWRYATHGLVNRAAAHPFWLLNKEWGDRDDLALMHNGILAGWDEADQSDTQVFAEFLHMCLRDDPHLIHRESFWTWLEEETKGSRLLFCGTNIEGGWRATPGLNNWQRTANGTYVSNSYSLDAPEYDYEDSYDYHPEPFEFVINRKDGSRWTIRYDERGRTETLLSSEPGWPRMDGNL